MLADVSCVNYEGYRDAHRGTPAVEPFMNE